MAFCIVLFRLSLSSKMVPRQSPLFPSCLWCQNSSMPREQILNLFSSVSASFPWWSPPSFILCKITYRLAIAKFISSGYISPIYSWILISKCLLDMSTWVSNRHLKLRSKIKLLIFPLKLSFSFLLWKNFQFFRWKCLESTCLSFSYLTSNSWFMWRDV